MKFFLETFLEEIKPAVSERYEFENRHEQLKKNSKESSEYGDSAAGNEKTGYSMEFSFSIARNQSLLLSY